MDTLMFFAGIVIGSMIYLPRMRAVGFALLGIGILGLSVNGLTFLTWFAIGASIGLYIKRAIARRRVEKAAAQVNENPLSRYVRPRGSAAKSVPA